MKRFLTRLVRNWLPAILLVTTIGGATLSVATPQIASAACSDRLLTFPAWYRGLIDTKDPNKCNIMNPADAGGLPAFLFKIALNIVEFMLQLVGYLSTAFILVGGFKYLLSTGTPDDIVKAKKTILNAVVGLMISIFSIAIVNVVAGIF